MTKTFFCFLKRFSDVERVSGAFAVSEKNRNANDPFSRQINSRVLFITRRKVALLRHSDSAVFFLMVRHFPFPSKNLELNILFFNTIARFHLLF